MSLVNQTILVAPHAGAWIETFFCGVNCKRGMVAPHAGAWIETIEGIREAYGVLVAPHAGAWIETNTSAWSAVFFLSRLMQARGLKLF